MAKNQIPPIIVTDDNSSIVKVVIPSPSIRQISTLFQFLFPPCISGFRTGAGDRRNSGISVSSETFNINLT